MSADKAKALAAALEALVRAHHEAFAVELLGVDAAGVPAERVHELITSGLLDPTKLGGMQIPHMRNPLDPFAYLRMVGQLTERASPETRHAMRSWGMAEWADKVDAEADATWTQPALPETHMLGVEDLEREPIPALESTLSTAQQASIDQARRSAGEYARGLGNRYGQELAATIAEDWDGETLTGPVDDEKRQAQLETIRRRLAQALEQGRTSHDLARDLASDTGRWTHDWERIAETELQGAYSEGIVVDAIDSYGVEAQIARIPEAGACDSCRGLFLGEDGQPIVFDVGDLIANGTNVGRRQASWRPTIWPVHPRCRCDTMVVPPGTVATAAGRLARA